MIFNKFGKVSGVDFSKEMGTWLKKHRIARYAPELSIHSTQIELYLNQIQVDDKNNVAKKNLEFCKTAIRNTHLCFGVDLFNEFVSFGTLFKILISSDIDTMLNLYKVINTEVGRDCNILFSSKNLLEITSVEATKGQALKFVADRLGIDIKDTIAIGDNYNDIDMIQVAGLGVAIFNAVDDLKSVADYVTKADNNKHAIKEIVDEFIL